MYKYTFVTSERLCSIGDTKAGAERKSSPRLITERPHEERRRREIVKENPTSYRTGEVEGQGEWESQIESKERAFLLYSTYLRFS